MTTDRDRQFEDNLRTLGKRAGALDGAAPGVKARCAEVLTGTRPQATRVATFRKRAWWSTAGLAAMLALAAIPLFSNGMPKVKAAVVLTKLSEQIEQSEVFEVSLADLTIEDQVWGDGIFQISDTALAGDIAVRITEGAGQIEADVSLGIHADGGWLLIRSLKVPDPEAQVFLDLMFPAGTETLLILPTNVVEEFFEQEIGGELAEVRSMATGEVAAFVKQIIESDEDLGVTITQELNGNLRLTLPIRNAGSLRDLVAMIARNMGEDPSDIELNDNDISDLVGATFSVVYDPEAEAVRSFSVSDLAELRGTVSISLLSGSIDPAYLDQDRVVGPDTRVLDLTALEGVLEGLLENID